MATGNPLIAAAAGGLTAVTEAATHLVYKGITGLVDGVVSVGKTIKGWLGFDSGGYTGDWSDTGMDAKGGKLAILHQKELVLNQEDTANFLDAIKIVRDIQSSMSDIPDFVYDRLDNLQQFQRDNASRVGADK
jgi:hypothetical protein